MANLSSAAASGQFAHLGGQGHPSRDQLERFMLGSLSRAEVQAVVRHLLTQCPGCGRQTRRIWSLGDRAPKEGTREGQSRTTPTVEVVRE